MGLSKGWLGSHWALQIPAMWTNKMEGLGGVLTTLITKGGCGSSPSEKVDGISKKQKEARRKNSTPAGEVTQQGRSLATIRSDRV